MGNRQTDRMARKQALKRMLDWGMDHDEIALCMDEIKERQTLKNKGELARGTPLCTRPEYTKHIHP